jgi:hypothetical protein
MHLVAQPQAKPPPTWGTAIRAAAFAALWIACAVVFLKEGLTPPESAKVTGSGEILDCEERGAGGRYPSVVVYVSSVEGGLIVQALDYLPYVRNACAAHAVVSWSAVLGSDGRPHVVAFERTDVPGGFTENTYLNWWRGKRVISISMAVGSLWVALVLAVNSILDARKLLRSKT